MPSKVREYRKKLQWFSFVRQRTPLAALILPVTWLQAGSRSFAQYFMPHCEYCFANYRLALNLFIGCGDGGDVRRSTFCPFQPPRKTLTLSISVTPNVCLWYRSCETDVPVSILNDIKDLLN